MKTINKERKQVWLIFLIVAGILAFIIFLLNIIQIPYTINVDYTEKEPYQTTEYYYEQTNTLNCDYVSGCSCIHNTCSQYSYFLWIRGDCENWDCDSCNCEKSRIITSYRDIVKTREETRYCALINRIVRIC